MGWDRFAERATGRDTLLSPPTAVVDSSNRRRLPNGSITSICTDAWKGHLQLRPKVPVAIRADLAVIVGQPGHAEEHRRAGAAVAVVFGQVERAADLGHLEVHRRDALEPVFPVRREAEEAEVELLRLRHLPLGLPAPAFVHPLAGKN